MRFKWGPVKPIFVVSVVWYGLKELTTCTVSFGFFFVFSLSYFYYLVML
jgi:hypothetical protein